MRCQSEDSARHLEPVVSSLPSGILSSFGMVGAYFGAVFRPIGTYFIGGCGVEVSCRRGRYPSHDTTELALKHPHGHVIE